ncbi:DSD1 family PLP-dependent enzyme [Ectopseudomonas hydrolytica]|uniref:DSD1 family PLP-dependent enzyme n=1 Tax=Ectopseudomonas hydrolytica TaxID=2493633 RepID=A0ABY5A5U1_9GAMM|nr:MULTISPECIES: DSD1 family PLP-dependent enzyme [Pseudomonas]MDH0096999.1 DSD1 family PLP-dependent enzyme [Pseudomonas sp. GD04158]USR39247.1 DSD1 family PLP-dependent enzyme [Pseudomonas hydrolytica]
MKRRHLLAVGALGLLAGWALRPHDRGQQHDAYFAALNRLLQQEGDGIPALLLDLDRLDANADLLAERLNGRLGLRLVSKSLASVGLLEYLAKRLQTQRFMVFHQPQLNRLARSFPQADLLLGKPMPVHAALNFYRQLPGHLGFTPARQLTWLIDSAERLRQYAELAQALGQPLRIALEIDIGMTRGGFRDPQALGQALQHLQDQPQLQLQGLMGYDAHVAHAPPWTEQRRVFADTNARYREFLAAARAFPQLWPRQPLLNGGGSLTYPLHSRSDTPLNEVAVGSALLKPGDFDTPALSEHQPALWIASPLLKVADGALPYLGAVQPLMNAWNPNREHAYYLYGGRWPAHPVSPAGLDYDALYGRSANQERLIGSAATGLRADDWVFLRPAISEGLLGGFGEMRLLRAGQLVGRWSTLPTG